MDRKVAVITGAANGIGYEIANKFSQSGYDLILCDIDEERLSRICKSLEKFNVKISSLACDLRKYSSITNLYRYSLDTFNKINVLISNAGIHYQGNFNDVTENVWDDVIDTNLKPVFFLSKYFGNHMVNNNGGCIVNIASISGRSGRKDQAPYAASKAGVISLTQSAAAEFGRFGVRVNAICPGVINTEMTRRIHEKRSSELNISYEESLARICSKIPLEKIGAKTHISDMASFLCSDKAAYVNGQAINVCGGLEMY